MKKRKIFFGLILFTISIIIGMAKIGGEKNSSNNNIKLLTKEDAPMVNNQYRQEPIHKLNGPAYKFSNKESLKNGKYSNKRYSPNFSLGEGRRYGTTEHSKIVNNNNSANGNIAIIGSNTDLYNHKSRRYEDKGLMATAIIGRSSFGNSAQLNLEPFVETGPISRIDTGGNVGDPVPAGDSKIPLAILSIAWILLTSLKRAHKG